MLISFNVLILRAAVDLHRSLNSSSGHTEWLCRYHVLGADILIKQMNVNGFGLVKLKMEIKSSK